MAKTKPGFILATSMLSGIAAILNFISLGTQEWIVSEPISNPGNFISSVNYGLFGGTFIRRLAENIAVHELKSEF